jgi:hypothetical protein
VNAGTPDVKRGLRWRVSPLQKGLFAHGECVVWDQVKQELYPKQGASIAPDTALIKMLEQDLNSGGEMPEEYQVEIEKLESAIKALLFIIAEHLPEDPKDRYGKPISIGNKLITVRKLLQQTQTFKSSWDE